MLGAYLLAVITLGSQVSCQDHNVPEDRFMLKDGSVMAIVEDRATLGDTGKWSVGNCLLADFSMKFHLNLNRTHLGINQTDYEVPADAVVNSDQANCQGTTNVLDLTWKEKAQNDSNTELTRKITATFKKAENASSPMYGMTRFVAVFEVGKFNASGNLSSSTVEMIYQAKPGNLVFQTPLDRSYTCKNIDLVTLNTTLRYDNHMNAALNATDMSATNVAFDAFRPKESPKSFRTPMDCDYKPNDIIPIAVGVALAALVVAVLVAYVVGRNRQRQRGYQSV